MTIKTAILKKKLLKRFLFLNLLIVLFFANSPLLLAQETIPQPYFLFPRNGNQTAANSQPIIRGETQNDTLVEIYIDNKLMGQAKVTNGPLFTAYFTYQPANNLRSGSHQIKAIAKNKNDHNIINTSIKESLYIIPFPAPTLFSLINESNNLILTGVAKNNSLINIYLDNQLQTSFQIINHSSGTASFSWTINKPLTLGQHTFYATARDLAGKLSLNSNLITYQEIIGETPPTAILKSPQPKPLQSETATKEPTTAVAVEPKQTTQVVIEPISEFPEPKVEDSTITQPLTISEPNNAQINVTIPTDQETNQPETTETKNDKSNFWLTVLAVIIIYIILRWLKKRLVAKKQEPPTTPKSPPTDSAGPPLENPKPTTPQPPTEPLWQPPKQTLPPIPKPSPPVESPLKQYPQQPIEPPISPDEKPPLPPEEPPPNNQLHYPF